MWYHIHHNERYKLINAKVFLEDRVFSQDLLKREQFRKVSPSCKFALNLFYRFVIDLFDIYYHKPVSINDTENHASRCGVRFRFALWFRPKRESCFLEIQETSGKIWVRTGKGLGWDLVYFKEWTCKGGWGELVMERHLSITAIRWRKHIKFMASDIDRCLPMMRVISRWFVYHLFVRHLSRTFIV